jgi:uncharacterized protein (DUF2236 family)
MQISHGEDQSAGVSRDDSEALLSAVARQTANPQAGIFGPDSMTWKINRESALFLGAGRAALLQLAHPWVATALAQHSSLLSKPIARFHNTFRIVFTMIFGSLDQALAAARHLYTLHTRIQGELPEHVAAYRQGSHYQANEIGALRWVYATLVESAVMAYERVLPPLTSEERETYYAESKIMASLFGIPAAALPEDWTAFKAYVAQMVESDALGVGQLARPVALNLLSGAGSWIHPPYWYRALTLSWLPPRFREEFGLEFSARIQQSADRAKHRLPSLYRRLPSPIRYIGPWHEAQARLNGRRIGVLAGMNNGFWLGQSRMPFARNGQSENQAT